MNNPDTMFNTHAVRMTIGGCPTVNIIYVSHRYCSYAHIMSMYSAFDLNRPVNIEEAEKKVRRAT